MAKPSKSALRRKQRKAQKNRTKKKAFHVEQNSNFDEAYAEILKKIKSGQIKPLTLKIDYEGLKVAHEKMKVAMESISMQIGREGKPGERSEYDKHKHEMDQIYFDVFKEREAQISKFGYTPAIALHQLLSVLMEEVGEAAKDINDHHHNGFTLQGYGPLRAELVQVAAVAFKMIQHLDWKAIQVKEGLEKLRIDIAKQDVERVSELQAKLDNIKSTAESLANAEEKNQKVKAERAEKVAKEKAEADKINQAWEEVKANISIGQGPYMSHVTGNSDYLIKLTDTLERRLTKNFAIVGHTPFNEKQLFDFIKLDYIPDETGNAFLPAEVIGTALNSRNIKCTQRIIIKALVSLGYELSFVRNEENTGDIKGFSFVPVKSFVRKTLNEKRQEVSYSSGYKGRVAKVAELIKKNFKHVEKGHLSSTFSNISGTLFHVHNVETTDQLIIDALWQLGWGYNYPERTARVVALLDVEKQNPGARFIDELELKKVLTSRYTDKGLVFNLSEDAIVKTLLEKENVVFNIWTLRHQMHHVFSVPRVRGGEWKWPLRPLSEIERNRNTADLLDCEEEHSDKPKNSEQVVANRNLSRQEVLTLVQELYVDTQDGRGMTNTTDVVAALKAHKGINVPGYVVGQVLASSGLKSNGWAWKMVLKPEYQPKEVKPEGVKGVTGGPGPKGYRDLTIADGGKTIYTKDIGWVCDILIKMYDATTDKEASTHRDQILQALEDREGVKISSTQLVVCLVNLGWKVDRLPNSPLYSEGYTVRATMNKGYFASTEPGKAKHVATPQKREVIDLTNDSFEEVSIVLREKIRRGFRPDNGSAINGLHMASILMDEHNIKFTIDQLRDALLGLGEFGYKSICQGGITTLTVFAEPISTLPRQ